MTDWQKVDEGVAAAVEIETVRRSAWLDKFCAGDDDLKREIESLLAFESDADGFLEQPFGPHAAALLESESNGFTGKAFGNYEVIREIGSGGMGAVFLARRNDGEFDQLVALKIIRQSIAESHIIERFKRERQILASLNHPNIAKLLDGGVSGSGEPFIAMEYIEGEQITDFVSRQNFSIEFKIKLFIKVCSAVAYAHRNLVIHRDVKPGNILVSPDGEPKLLDFGLAKLIDESLLSDPTQTQTAFRALTPAYASPEQLKGEPLTTASDIYSLGVIFYELLAGRRPFLFEGKSLNQIIETVTGIAPQPPSSQSALHSQQLKGDLDNIALMALRNEAERRYVTVDQFTDDIERYIKGMPVLARSNTLTYRTSKYLGRHRIGVSAAILVFVTLITGVVISLWQTRQARLEKAKAEAVSKFLQTMLDASSPVNGLQSADHEVTVKDVLNDASTRLANEDLSGQPEIQAELQRIIGSSYYNLGQYDLAEQNLTAALETQTRIYGEDNLETLQTTVVLAGLWVAKGDNAKADAFYRSSIPYLRAAFKNRTIPADYFLESFCDFAIVRRAQGDSKEAESLLRESLSLASQIPETFHGIVNNSRIVLALTLADQGRFYDATQIIVEESEATRLRPDALPIERGVNVIFLGRFQMEMCNLSEAEKNLAEGEDIYRKIFSQSKLELGDTLRLEAETFYLEAKYVEAEKKIDEALQIYHASTNVSYINYPTALRVKGMIYSRTHRISEAEKLLREAVALRVQNLPSSHFMSATDDGALGEFLANQKRFDEAEPLLLKSFESLKGNQSSESPRIRTAAKRLRELYIAWNKPEFAEKYAVY